MKTQKTVKEGEQGNIRALAFKEDTNFSQVLDPVIHCAHFTCNHQQSTLRRPPNPLRTSPINWSSFDDETPNWAEGDDDGGCDTDDCDVSTVDRRPGGSKWKVLAVDEGCCKI
ncbi:hypothetical protein L1987_22210 [Smallanthus sonchifolius]|uniref:Uncharacterized protein n=1 Tax=Smallanthus sonchifolius TaxID=185202 RepID=A0ACB9IFP4_9ASTR|nr:hypothetical protein L1987_22210 [Smallanthus sonchifolius]